MKRQPSAYEQPKTIKQTPPKQTTIDDYDTPLELESSTLPIATSHTLKLPAEYDEVAGEPLDQNPPAGSKKPAALYDEVPMEQILTAGSQKPTTTYDEVPMEQTLPTGEAHIFDPSTTHDKVASENFQGVYDLATEPHDYINQQDTVEQETGSGYHLLEDVNMSPSSTHQFGDIHSAIPASTQLASQPSNGHIHSQKAKTLQAQAQMNYETPLDADSTKSHTFPANFQGNLEDYETPLDAKNMENYEIPQDASLI